MAQKRKKMTVEEELLTIPNFLRREISPDNIAVRYENVEGKLYKVDAEGNYYDAHTNKMRRVKKAK